MALWKRGAGKEPVEYNEDTGVQTSAGIAVSGRCIFQGAIVKTDDTNDVTVTFYDSLEASGAKAIDTLVLQAEKGTHFIAVGKMCANGIYVDISGGTFSWQVLYDN